MRKKYLKKLILRDTHGAVVLYDCKRPETLDGAFRWKKDMDTKLALNNEQPIPAILIANKVCQSLMTESIFLEFGLIGEIL